MSVQTILFDLDGTLIDTNELIIQSFIYTFAQYGYSFTREEMAAFNGPPLKDTFEWIDPENAEDMIHTYRQHNFANHAQYVTCFPYVKDVLATLNDRGYDLGIVTTKLQKAVDIGLEVTDIANYFKTIVTLDDVTRSKPHPEPVLKAMNALKGQDSTTLMIGDNYHDIEAGHRANVMTAGVAWSGKGEQAMRDCHPTYMLQTMNDLLPIVGIKTQ